MNIIVKILISLTLIFPEHTYSISPFPWYHAYFHEYNAIRYKKNCTLINYAQKIRQAALLTYYKIAYNTPQARTAIEAKHAEIAAWVYKIEQDILISIKEKYAISDEIWQKFLTNIEKTKKVYRNGMLLPHPETIHDTAIPTDTLRLLIKVLELNDINPHSINLTIITDPVAANIKQNVKARAKMVMYIPTKDADNHLIFSDTYIPPTITLLPKMYTQSIKEQLSSCAHEVQHLIQQHPITEIIILDYLAHYCGIDSEEFKKTAEYHQLSQIHEAQAELFAAIKNPTLARSLKNLRKETYYPKHLYEEHFYHLSTIDMLWNIKAQLLSKA
jgi:hypothetical protein